MAAMYDSDGNYIGDDGTDNNQVDAGPPAPDPAGDIVSGSFGNNGGSSGDNGANGGGSAGTDTGNGQGSQGENPGPPTQADIDLYKQQLKESNPTWTDAQLAQHVSTLLNNISSANPNWAGAIGKLAGGVVNGATGGSTPGGTSNGGGLGTTDPMGLLAAAGLAYQQFNNAKQYTTQAEKYAQTLNPYGAYRDAAAQKLAALQADPSSITQTPGYQFALSQGLGSVANRDNRSFGVGAGSTNPDMMNYAQGLASKTYNDTINQYSQQAGVNIGPQSAADILGKGMQGNIASQNNAINALMSPFGPGNNTGGANGQPGGGIDWSKIFGGAAQGVDLSGIAQGANGGGVSQGTQDTTQTQDPNLPPSNGSYGSYTGGA